MRNWVAGIALVFFSLTTFGVDDSKKEVSPVGPSCIILASADFALTDLISLPILINLQKSLIASKAKYLDDLAWVNSLLVDYQLEFKAAMATLFPNVPNDDQVKISTCAEQARIKMASNIAFQLLQKGDHGYEFLAYYFGNSPKTSKARIDNLADLLALQGYLANYQLKVVTDLIALYQDRGKLADEDLIEAVRTYSRRAIKAMELPKTSRLYPTGPNARLGGFVRERVEHFATTEQAPLFAREFAQRQIEIRDMFAGYFPLPPAWLDYLYLLEVGIREAK